MVPLPRGHALGSSLIHNCIKICNASTAIFVTPCIFETMHLIQSQKKIQREVHNYWDNCPIPSRTPNMCQPPERYMTTETTVQSHHGCQLCQPPQTKFDTKMTFTKWISAKATEKQFWKRWLPWNEVSLLFKIVIFYISSSHPWGTHTPFFFSKSDKMKFVKFIRDLSFFLKEKKKKIGFF